ncbi:sensor domain-containing diguanylate cyclase [Ancylobacter sp. WKF20]|uniref:GGDEF domain-containing protein n=1 Tax=Ancylobacter sp. WKF20 TaxID=3039801 RepID=UPI00243459B7|nr:sensor domain-containing diguanylate cyclase [Ancylobacter sp. WKF20]WGD30192.1 sensor domain-containing diguanylate cyclase [Ancylobacter sp. WKF20]
MWRVPDHPANEAERLAVLEALAIMDTPRDERFDRIAWLAQNVYGADVAFVSFIDGASQWMKACSGPGLSSTIARDRSVCQHIIASGEPLMSPDLQTDARFAGHPSVPHLPFRFYAGVPLLLTPDLAVGSVCVLRREPARPRAPFDFAPLQALAAIALDALELWRRNENLAQESRLDALTGLTNRRGFDEALLRLAGRCLRTSEPLALLLIDVDHFKAINDQLGHPAGDEVLRRLGATLAGTRVRVEDVIARYGGEEFALLLPGSNAEAAGQLAVGIRQTIASSGAVRPDGRAVTVSIGVAVLEGGEGDAPSLIAAADNALYRAKRQGRDCVVEAPTGTGRSVAATR